MLYDKRRPPDYPEVLALIRTGHVSHADNDDIDHVRYCIDRDMLKIIFVNASMMLRMSMMLMLMLLLMLMPVVLV